MKILIPVKDITLFSTTSTNLQHSYFDIHLHLPICNMKWEEKSRERHQLQGHEAMLFSWTKYIHGLIV